MENENIFFTGERVSFGHNVNWYEGFVSDLGTKELPAEQIYREHVRRSRHNLWINVTENFLDTNPTSFNRHATGLISITNIAQLGWLLTCNLRLTKLEEIISPIEVNRPCLVRPPENLGVNLAPVEVEAPFNFVADQFIGVGSSNQFISGGFNNTIQPDPTPAAREHYERMRELQRVRYAQAINLATVASETTLVTSEHTHTSPPAEVVFWGDLFRYGPRRR